MRIKIADIVGEIYFRDKGLKDYLQHFLHSYITNEKPYFKIAIYGTSSDLKMHTGRTYQVSVEDHKGKYNIVFNRGKQRFILGDIEPKERVCSLNLKKISNYSNLLQSIRVCFHFFIEREGGFFLHASCGTIDGKAYIFTGKHNSGKSTALKNLKPERVIAEDSLAIRNNGNTFSVFSIPFRKETSRRGKAQAIIFPKKSTGSPRIERESITSSAAEVISNTMFSSPNNPQIIEPVIVNIIDFCSSVSRFSLYAQRDGDIREVITS